LTYKIPNDVVARQWLGQWQEKKTVALPHQIGPILRLTRTYAVGRVQMDTDGAENRII
jgi:hypothetical protein